MNDLKTAANLHNETRREIKIPRYVVITNSVVKFSVTGKL